MPASPRTQAAKERQPCHGFPRPRGSQPPPEEQGWGPGGQDPSSKPAFTDVYTMPASEDTENIIPAMLRPVDQPTSMTEYLPCAFNNVC